MSKWAQPGVECYCEFDGRSVIRVRIDERGRIGDPKWGLEPDPDGDMIWVTPLEDRPDGYSLSGFYAEPDWLSKERPA